MKPKACKWCGEDYVPQRGLQRACSPYCERHLVRLKVFNAETRHRKDKLKTFSVWAAEAQPAMNRYIRARDVDKPCISCGQSPYQGQRHASHYRARSVASQLAFNTWNIHASCSQCNSMKSGNPIPYRIELIKRIGIKKVEWLECNNELATYDIEYLKRIKRIFNKRARRLENGR